MRTTVLNYFHTFHPEATEKVRELAAEDQRLATAIARRGEVDLDEPPKRRRASEARDDFEAQREVVAAQIAEQQDIIKSGVVRIVIKGLTRGEFRRLLTEHGPREDVPEDERVGYNVDTFGEALIAACIVGTQDQHGKEVPNEWDKWADDMTNGQWEEIFIACLKLTNDGSPSLPR